MARFKALFLVIMVVIGIILLIISNIPVPIPIGVLDYIHQPDLKDEFLKADQLKYRLKYPESADAFKSVLNNRKIENLQDSFYCFNQLAYLNLCMYRDSEAMYWIKLIDTLGGENKMKRPGAKGDYFYNKGTWGYNTGQLASVPEYYKKAISNYKLEYLKTKSDTMHHRIGQTKVKLGLFYLSFNVDSAYALIMEAFDYYHHPPSLQNYQGEVLLAYATLCRWEREYDNSIKYAIIARKILKSQPFVDSLSLCRTYALETYLRGTKQTKEEVEPIKYELMAKNDTFFSLFKKLKTVRRFELLSDYLFSMHRNIYFNPSIAALMYQNYLKEINIEDIGLGKAFFSLEYHKGLYFERKAPQLDSASMYYASLWNAIKSPNRHPFAQTELGIQALVDLLTQQHKYVAALKFNTADILLGTHFLKDYLNKSVPLSVLKSPELLNDKKYLFYSFGMRGNVYKSRYKYYNKVADLDSSFYFYKLVDSLFFPKIIASDEEAILRYLDEVGAEIYNNAIDVIFELYLLQRTPELKKKYIKYALRFVEHRKAFLLYYTLNSHGRTDYNKSERNLLDSLQKYQNLLGSPNTNSEHILGRMKRISRDLRPNYLKYSNRVASLEEVMNHLPDQTSFVHYIVADSCTFILQISKHDYSFLRTEVKKRDLDSLINTLRHSIINSGKLPPPTTSKPNADYLSCNNNLYDKLIKPISAKIKHQKNLIISPDRYLTFLPFDALMEKTTKPINSWKDAPFLINKFNIIYTPAWKIYAYKSKPNLLDIKKSKTVLAMAYGRKAKAFMNQAIELNNAYPQTIIRTGWQCNKSTAKKLMPKQEVIFLSMHGSADINDSDKNKLYFSEDKRKLQSSMSGTEIAALKLDNTKLVALSSCETSIGKDNPAEGTFSITRSFLQAGSKCVIGALWETPINANKEVFNCFWMKSKDNCVEESLCAAKRQYLQNHTGSPEKWHPYLWAGLVLTR